MKCPSCDKDVRPQGFATGLQDLLAMRIHLHRDHGVFKDTQDMLDVRAEMEDEGMEGGDGVVWIDIDRDERWLEMR